MRQFHPKNRYPQTCYFYLSSPNGNLAEIIQVLNCTSASILIPVPEEDVELHSFFERDMTDSEIIKFGRRSTWNIYTSWTQLEAYHRKYGISPDTMMMLLGHKGNKPLPKERVEVA